MAKTLLEKILKPNLCAACGRSTDEDDFLCYYCTEMLEHCDPIKRCKVCGVNKKGCQCRRHVFHFDFCIAPLVNTGVARKLMHRFKFRKKENLAEFFAEKMALCIRNEYRDISFDGICYVPMSHIKRLRRGYNQSELLAERLSKIFGIPLYNLLSCKYTRTVQHNLSEKERFSNVKGKYTVTQNVNGKRLLLIDDIKTTGATLNECAKRLLMAGADGVYCATALISERKRKKKG